MRILITNNTLATRAGSELYVRDVALALLRSGHDVVAYSRQLGDVAEELRQATVPVVDDLEHVAAPPDLIHGQHHLETMAALLRFPAVPAVFVCHGWLPPEEAPPPSPRIRRYLAVDHLVRERLVSECGIPPERVAVHPNFVDLARFRPRPPLPSRPARALVFSNHVWEGNWLPVLRAACADRGIALDVVGAAVGAPCRRPEEVLGAYDVVFAKGRAALEAAAVGAAVVLCDAPGLGPLVTSAELDRLRSLNFGVRLLSREPTQSAVAAELARYDPDDAARVTRRLRVEADLDAAVERLVGVYEEVLAEHRRLGPPASDAEGRAHSRYLRRGPLTGGDFFRREREQLLQTTARLEAERDAALAAAEGVSRELEKLRARAEPEAAARARELERERDWITGSFTWRLRAALVRRRWLVALYRRLRRG